ncbi:hypothetical protein Syun_012544 [Stephania yunnanensis]|uniref:Uncharacterized protein n=1 Tax=Stephania yunnanensis TaxID=152371 RepID=A0AAP0K0E9_9MAGN
MGVSEEGPGRPRWPDQRAGTVMHLEGSKDKQLGPQVVEPAAAPGGGRVVGSRQSQVVDCAGQSQCSAVLGAKPRHHRVK